MNKNTANAQRFLSNFRPEPLRRSKKTCLLKSFFSVFRYDSDGNKTDESNRELSLLVVTVVFSPKNWLYTRNPGYHFQRLFNLLLLTELKSSAVFSGSKCASYENVLYLLVSL
jgi:hypothetical protein